ncbi:MAG: hypothetical protein WAK95_10285 [Desulfobacterales bacterium]
MKPGKICAAVLIVLGVILIMGGINGFHKISLFGSEIESMGRVIKEYGGRAGNGHFIADQYLIIVQKEKIKCILMILLGAAGAVGGALILRNSGLPDSSE